MTGPHQNQPLVTAGASLEAAEAAVVLVHGRGATAQSIVQMTEEFDHDDIAYLAPQAARNTWYSNAFTAPVESNEPGRTSGLQAIADAVSKANEADIPTDRVMILGFSQGACLASEFVGRTPRRYGGIAVLSGALIGEDIDPDDYEGDLANAPVFLGCSDVDPHIPEERVRTTADIFERMDADVTMRLYEGMGHGINEDELRAVTDLLDGLSRDEPE